MNFLRTKTKQKTNEACSSVNAIAHAIKIFFALVISVPVGYQKVEGGDGEEEEGEGERGGEGEKGQELRVMNGSAGGGGEKTATKKKGSKPPQSHTVTKVR